MVSVDFQLSVLELVAELLRTAPSFLVIIDQQFPLRGGHKSSVWCGDSLRSLSAALEVRRGFVGVGVEMEVRLAGCHGRLHGGWARARYGFK